MHFLIIVITVCFFIFLFVLHFLSRDDFVLLRKDVSLEKLFNIAFIMLGASLFFSRLTYVISNPSGNFLNPLYFLLFPYFPGLSLIGGVLGTVGSLYLISSPEKMPRSRLIDLFTFSAVSVFPVGSLGYFLLAGKIFSWQSLLFLLVFLVLFVTYYVLLLPKFLKGRIREGNVSAAFLVFLSLTCLLSEVIFNKKILNVENIVLVLTLFGSIAFYIQRENLISRITRR